ncbi:hypothetical protein [Shinella sp.]|jgi:hypothetical protein|uniref:hypothetical protein n=1 Tax=Shinella sp. TaxID=1870904 RepID=UPI003F70217D
MRRVEVYKSDDGNLEEKLDRAKAHDLHKALPKCSANPNAKVLDWIACLYIMENAEIVMQHLSEFLELKDTAPKR